MDMEKLKRFRKRREGKQEPESKIIQLPKDIRIRTDDDLLQEIDDWLKEQGF